LSIKKNTQLETEIYSVPMAYFGLKNENMAKSSLTIYENGKIKLNSGSSEERKRTIERTEFA
jgi:hypothetical protein